MTDTKLKASRLRLWLVPILWLALMPLLFYSFYVSRNLRQPPPANSPINKAGQAEDPDILLVHVVDDENEAGLADATLVFDIRVGNSVQRLKETTDDDGHCEAALPVKRADLTRIEIIARAPNRVPGVYDWRISPDSTSLPDSVNMRLQPGTTIGGLVTNEEGQPIANCKIEIGIQDASGVVSYTPWRSATTDQQGRWQCDSIPAGLVPNESGQGPIRVSYRHPEYIDIGHFADPPPALEELRAETATVGMKRGAVVMGQVLDPAGKPVEGAWIKVGFGQIRYEDRIRSDDQGRFRVTGCTFGDSALAVSMEGFAYQHMPIAITQPTLDLGRIQLSRPVTLHGRVVDRQGNPLPDTSISSPASSSDHLPLHGLRTDEQGRFQWEDAPKGGEVVFSFDKAGYLARYDVPLSASNPENVVVLDPEFVIRGRVVDTETSEPVDRFKVIGGYAYGPEPRYSWIYSTRPTMGAAGDFEFSFDNQQDLYGLRIEAEGYLAAVETGLAYSADPIERTFALTRVAPIEGLVLQPDGEPAVKTELAVFGEDLWPHIQNGRFSQYNSDLPLVKTSEEGRFTLHPTTKRFHLIALHETGYAIIGPGESIPEQIKLYPWARVQGKVMLGSQPGSGEKIHYRSSHEPALISLWGREFSRNIRAAFQSEANCDNEGNFSLDRVLPGPGTLSRTVTASLPMASGSSHAVDLRPAANETIEVTLGGTGRAVIGKIDLSRIGPEWRRSEVACASAGGTLLPLEQFTNYQGVVKSDGSFRIEDLEAGEYSLSIDLHGPRERNDDQIHEPTLGRVRHSFTIPKMPNGRSDEPLDLGTLAPMLPR